MSSGKHVNRKLDGWVERRRRFQKASVAGAHGPVESKVPAADLATKPKSAPDSAKATKRKNA
jgi:hypothetical protein